MRRTFDALTPICDPDMSIGGAIVTDLETTCKLGLVGTRSPHFVSEIFYVGCGYLALKLSPPTLKTKSALLNDKIESWLLLLQHLSHVTIVTY